MNLEEGKQYILNFGNGDIQATFSGEEKNFSWYNCDKCGKEINHIFFFEEGDREQSYSVYTLGSECVKKVLVKGRANK